jgi:hypothetical protein
LQHQHTKDDQFLQNQFKLFDYVLKVIGDSLLDYRALCFAWKNSKKISAKKGKRMLKIFRGYIQYILLGIILWLIH